VGILSVKVEKQKVPLPGNNPGRAASFYLAFPDENEGIIRAQNNKIETGDGVFLKIPRPQSLLYQSV
jgi:hypothetical protein